MLGYGQQAGGTHPTGMQSCYTCVLFCSGGGEVCIQRGLSRPPPAPSTADTVLLKYIFKVLGSVTPPQFKHYFVYTYVTGIVLGLE